MVLHVWSSDFCGEHLRVRWDNAEAGKVGHVEEFMGSHVVSQGSGPTLMDPSPFGPIKSK